LASVAYVTRSGTGSTSWLLNRLVTSEVKDAQCIGLEVIFQDLDGWSQLHSEC
jgi:hypothetical protein